MKIKEIILKNFKRFSSLTIKDIPESAKLILLVGPNGAGKTSVFEAFNHWANYNAYHTIASEMDFYLKDVAIKLGHNWYENLVEIKWYGNKPTQDEIKKMFYFRTAYRNDPDFTVQQLVKQQDPTERIRFNNLLDPDAAVSQNYQRLVSLTLGSVYNSSNDTKTVAELKEILIGKVRKSLAVVFEDLQLENIGDPLENGSFYFNKGDAKDFHYKNLSAGEKSAFDLILDLVLKKTFYSNAVFCIDEPEMHMHTALQARLLSELYNLIPENGQMWLATHSIGMLKKAKEIEEQSPGTVVFLDFSNIDFDAENVLSPAQIDATIWRKFLDLAFDDFAKLIAPETIVFCEGTSQGRKNKSFDAQVYERIFKNSNPQVCFVSVGSCTDLENDNNTSMQIVKQVLRNSRTIKIVDRDDRSVEQILELQQQGIKVLSKRHLECFLLDDEIIKKLCESKGRSDKYDDIILIKEKAIESSKLRGNPPDDIKSAAGEIVNAIKKELALTQCGNDTHSFLRDTMTNYVTPDTEIYKLLQQDIWGEQGEIK